MRVTSVTGVNYSPRTIRQAKPVKNVAIEQKVQAQQVNFQGSKWKVAQALSDGFIGFILGGPLGAAIGVAVGLGVGHQLDKEDP